MELNKILGKILELTKNIYLKKPEEKSYKYNTPLNTIPIPMELWITKTGKNISREIALMSMQYKIEFKNGNINDFKEIVKIIFDRIIFNEELFKVKLISGSQKDKLFDYINDDLDKKDFAMKVWDIMTKEFSDNLKDWIIFYPLSRVTTKSLKLEFDGLSLVNSEDKEFWDMIVNEYPALEFWDPKKGKQFDSSDNIFSHKSPKSWLVCEVNGSKDISQKRASILMRKFIGVLLAHLYIENSSVLKHAGRSETTYSMQISSDSNTRFNYPHIGIILHSLLIDLEITSEVINEVKDWYKKQSESENFNRASKGAQFIQYGITRKTELDKFIHYFISLDALFGEKSRVEESISEGVFNTYTKTNHEVDKDKIKKIYKLRSDLVHGGSSYINDWKEIIDYRNHFNSDPLKDVQDIAIKSLVYYFEK
ncbi:HEPN domain-containing protein [Halanaerobium congolense]|jgi:hypothetical protein|uniref:HEPN domain-containing protein n=1 Tax=Halanaerobium congolense TaxID=54121 RepID=UPI0010603CC7|nr:HEPN domain-containing protein [Halanaerobium congolense]TDP24114.1 hypothetical protein C8C79_1074 [Halanaerobium congolense]